MRKTNIQQLNNIFYIFGKKLNTDIRAAMTRDLVASFSLHAGYPLDDLFSEALGINPAGTFAMLEYTAQTTWCTSLNVLQNEVLAKGDPNLLSTFANVIRRGHQTQIEAIPDFTKAIHYNVPTNQPKNTVPLTPDEAGTILSTFIGAFSHSPTDPQFLGWLVNSAIELRTSPGARFFAHRLNPTPKF